MAIDEIITALKNAVEHGESLQQAKEIMINSGYNPKDVEEASKYVSSHSLPKIGEDQHLLMPDEKKIKKVFKPLTKHHLPEKNKKSFKEKKVGLYFREIVLFIILLILLGVLAVTIIFRKTIISLVS